MHDLFSRVRSLWRALWRRSALEAEMDEEFRLHLELRTEDLIRAGLSPTEAVRRARLEFGGIERYKEEARDARGTRWIADAAADVKYAARVLRKSPAFTAAAVFTLALGIGATTSMFGVVDALFLSPPAGVMAADELVRLYVVRDEGRIQAPRGAGGSYRDYVALRENARGFAGIAAFGSAEPVDLDRGEAAQRITAQVVTADFLDVLGVRPAHGRFFMPADTAADANPVVVISDRFREHHFGGVRDVLGRTLLLNGTVATVIGVAAEGFTGIDPEPVDVWVPAARAAPLGLAFEGWRETVYAVMIDYIGRLAPGAAPARARESAAAALRHAAEQAEGLDQDPGVVLGPLLTARGPHRSEPASVALWLALATGLVLLVASANVANLLLARATARRREIAIRLSLGVSRGRLLRQLLTESLVLALLGGVAGLLLAIWGAALMRQFPLPPAAGRLDLRMLGFAAAVTCATGLLFGLAPAIHGVRTDPAAGLKESEAAGRPSRGRLRRALVAGQAALALVALIGAGLFVRSLGRVLSIEPGVDLDRVAVVSVDLENAGYDAAARRAFVERARERLESIPGVERVSSARVVPLSRVAYGVGFDLPGPDSLVISGEGPYSNWVTPGYFRTVGMRLLEGRAFTAADREGAPPVAVVNERMARIIAPGGDVVGGCLVINDQVEEGGCTEVVGVVSDRRQRILDPPIPYVILPWAQHPDASAWVTQLLVRTRGEPATHAGAIRSAVQGLAPDLPFVSVEPMETLVREDLLPFRIGALLSTLFGLLALALAGVGLYGVLGYFVAERTPELGIRRSLGARERDVARLVVRQAMAPVGVGLVIGLGLALAGTRLLESLLFDVSVRDPLTLAAVAFFLMVVALGATLPPARRAAKVDPMVALRAE